MKTNLLYSSACVLGCLALACGSKAPQTVSPQNQTAGEPVFLEEDMDSSVRPGDNFFRYVNGELSLGENIADFGGLTITLEAYRLAQNGIENPPLEGFTPEQRPVIW